MVKQVACGLNQACETRLSGLMPQPEGSREQLSTEQVPAHSSAQSWLIAAVPATAGWSRGTGTVGLGWGEGGGTREGECFWVAGGKGATCSYVSS